jgi:hypothetical protein
VEKPPPFSPLALALPLPLRSASTLVPATMLAIGSHHRAASVLSDWAIRSALTPCTFCNEFLPGAPATKAGQCSTPRRRLPPYELIVDCCAPPSFGHASTSRRSPGVSRPTSATPSPPMTSCPSHRCLPPHPCPPPPVSTLPSHAPDPNHHCVLYLPDTFLSGESPPTGRNLPEKH